MAKKLYYAVWFWRLAYVGSNMEVVQSDWCHHGSFGTVEDARDEARSLRSNGERVEIRRQDW